MGIGVSVFLIAVGAILAFAVDVQTSGIDLATVGVILMVVGVHRVGDDPPALRRRRMVGSAHGGGERPGRRDRPWSGRFRSGRSSVEGGPVREVPAGRAAG